MNCPGCHAEVSPGAKFCGKCGTKLEVVEEAAGVSVTTPSANAQVTTQPVSAAASGGSGADVPVPGGDGSGAGTPVFHRTPHGPAAANGNFAGGGYTAATGFASTSGGASAGGYAAPTGYAAAPQGCLGAAWHDITSSPGWVKRVLLLMVMNCVPVLNFFAKGYNLQWGAQAARGDVQPLPRGVFGKKTFLAGVLFAVINLLGGIASAVLYALNLIPLVGFIAALVADLFVGAFLSLAAVRMMLYRSFGEAFELSELCAKYKKSLGSLFAAACVPGIIVGVAFFLVVTVVLVVMVLVSMAGSSGYYGYGYDSSSLMYYLRGFGYDPVGSLFALLSVFGVLTLVLAALYFFANGLAEIWSMRAVGHWVARNAPDWVEEARDSRGVLS